MSGHLREWRRDRYRTGQHSTNDVHTCLEKKPNCDLVNHQHFHLVLSTKVQFNSIQFYFNSAITIQLSLGALQSPEPETLLVQAQWQHGQEKLPVSQE